MLGNMDMPIQYLHYLPKNSNFTKILIAYLNMVVTIMCVIQCERRRMSQPTRVIDEFNRLANAAIAANESVIPTPTTDMNSSFLSSRKKTARNGVAVGKTTFQDLARFANTNILGIREKFYRVYLYGVHLRPYQNNRKNTKE